MTATSPLSESLGWAHGWHRAGDLARVVPAVGQAVGEEVLVVGQPEPRRAQVVAPAAGVLVAGDLLLVPLPPRAAPLVPPGKGAGVGEGFPAAEGGAAARRSA